MLKESFEITNKTDRKLKVTSSLPAEPTAISSMEMDPDQTVVWFQQPTKTSIVIEVC